MAWGGVSAAGFDYIENLGLDISRWNEPMTPWPQTALVAAMAGFAGIDTSLLYALTGSSRPPSRRGLSDEKALAAQLHSR
jgi:hypothetical protein